MTRKDYIAAADIVRAADATPAERRLLAGAFVELFRPDNGRFDRDRFLTACDVEDEQPTSYQAERAARVRGAA